jgi:hypothetical protein
MNSVGFEVEEDLGQGTFTLTIKHKGCAPMLVERLTKVEVQIEMAKELSHALRW